MNKLRVEAVRGNLTMKFSDKNREKTLDRANNLNLIVGISEQRDMN